MYINTVLLFIVPTVSSSSPPSSYRPFSHYYYYYFVPQKPTVRPLYPATVVARSIRENYAARRVWGLARNNISFRRRAARPLNSRREGRRITLSVLPPVIYTRRETLRRRAQPGSVITCVCVCVSGVANPTEIASEISEIFSGLASPRSVGHVNPFDGIR